MDAWYSVADTCIAAAETFRLINSQEELGQAFTIRQNVVNTSKSPPKRQRNANIDAVWTSTGFWRPLLMAMLYRGLDNAGKTTIVKRIMNEDVTTVSPTLGFIIKTIDFMG